MQSRKTLTQTVVRPTVTAEPTGTVDEWELRYVPLSMTEDRVLITQVRDFSLADLFTFSLESYLTALELPYKVVKPIPIKVTESSGGYIASFSYANVNASGNTVKEAITNLEYMLVDVFELLSSHKPNSLGPGPTEQLSVMKHFMKKQ